MIMKNTIRCINATLLMVVMLASSCVDQSELNIPKGFDETIVIQGRLAQGNPALFELNVSRLFDFTVESLDRVNVRTVILEDETGNSIEIPRTGTGIYNAFINSSEMLVDPGKSYKVKVSTFDGRNLETLTL